MTRPGAEHRTQSCRGCRRPDKLESEMVPASKVLGEGKRGWFCQGCAERWAKRATVHRETDDRAS